MNFVKFASKKGSLVLHGMAKNSSAVLVLTLIFVKIPYDSVKILVDKAC